MSTTATKEAPRTSGPPDPFDSPVLYLRHHGWKCQGGDPRSKLARWLDPTKPEKGIDEKKFAYDKVLPNGEKQQVYQTEHTQAAWPITQDEAVQIQMDRDTAAKN